MADEEPGDFFDYLGAVPISNARTLGLGAFVVGVIGLAVNAFRFYSEGSYYPFSFPFVFPAALAGLSLLLIGQPRTATGEPALWGRVVLVVSLTIGAGLGIAATLLMLANF